MYLVGAIGFEPIQPVAPVLQTGEDLQLPGTPVIHVHSNAFSIPLQYGQLLTLSVTLHLRV